ncbi:MAG: hypothetical protein MUF58_02535 [Arcicella sp.]|jgi:hypothetical protein|nr:hypothetical protein [Arcicella sp.]
MNIEFTKEMVKEAFLSNKRKRNFMLYKVYESIFTYDHTAEFIATFISQDLGIPISKSIIDMTRIRVAKKLQNPKKATKKVSTKSSKKTVSSKKSGKKEVIINSNSEETKSFTIIENLPKIEVAEPLQESFHKTLNWRTFNQEGEKDLDF